MASTVDSTFSDLTITPDFFSSAPTLQSNLGILSHDQIELAKILLENGQSHLFLHWLDPGVYDKEKLSFFDQIARLNSSYPGGLAAYIKTAKKLLADSKVGKNPYDGFSFSVPTREKLTFGDENFIEMEKRGVAKARKATFVLVDGGLGESFGYNGIKVAFPRETTTWTCFFQHNIESMLALQEASNKVMDIWLAYAPVKKNSEDASKAGVKVEEPLKQVLNGKEVEVWSRITWKPKWGMIFSDIKIKVSGNCEVSQRSTMAIMGRNVFIEGLSLDGALIIDSVDDAKVKLGGLIKNSGWAMESVDYKDTYVPEEIRIRGFRFNKVEQLENKFAQPGRFSMED